MPRGFPTLFRHVRQNSPSEAVSPHKNFRKLSATSIGTDKSGRYELGKWVTHPHHPLTARVFVNRVWQGHFGRGLVSTPDNFGRLGESPSHPELLDWLTRSFIENGWSVKKLHRQIVLSATYRQSSATASGHDAAVAIDAENKMLWKMPRRRLEAEVIRDSMLLVTGSLNTDIGGDVNQWQPKVFFGSAKDIKTATYSTRRSIYLPVVRSTAGHAMLRLFDFPDPNTLVSQRSETSVASQALFFLNSAFVSLECWKSCVFRNFWRYPIHWFSQKLVG